MTPLKTTAWEAKVVARAFFWAYCITGLDWTGLDWTGLVKRGLVKRGLVKRGLVKLGLVKRGLVNAQKMLALLTRSLAI